MALKKCKECKKEVSSKAKTCPNCGVSKPCGSGNGLLLLIIGGIVAVFLISGVQKGQNLIDQAELRADLSSVDDRGLKVQNLKMETGEYGVKVVTGILENTNNKQYGYVQVEINLYDENGVQVGSTIANANNLEPNGKWRFKAPIIEKSASTAKLKGISAF